MALLNYYKMLGVEMNADENAITTAFRKKALELHPDKNPSPQANEMFEDIYLAYSVLTDPVERSKYDEKLNFEIKKAEEERFQNDPFANYIYPNSKKRGPIREEYDASSFKIYEMEREPDLSPQARMISLVGFLLIILVFILTIIFLFYLAPFSDPAPPHRFLAPIPK